MLKDKDTDFRRQKQESKKSDEEVKKAGSTLRSPFMTLSFMALLVIPALKLSDLGLFDGKNFTLLERGVGKPGIL
jgi:adenine deaminase